MEYVEQSATDIQYCFTQGNLDLTQFTSLSTTNFKWQSLAITLSIIGESHYIQFQEAESDPYTEICACTNIVLGDTTPLIAQIPLFDLQTKDAVKLNELSYNFSFSKENLATASTYLTAVRKQIEQTKNGLVFEFTSHEDFTHTPMTLVSFTPEIDSLKIETAHVYPNEDIVVQTKTCIT